MRHTRHILSYSGGKDSTAMYLLAMELAERHGFEFFPVFADTGNEHEATLDYVRDLPRRTGGPEIRWVKADFAEDFERIEAWEITVGMCSKREDRGWFFATDKTARRDKTKPPPSIRDVAAWASTGLGGRQYDLLKNADNIPRCSSIYGLCE